MHGLKIHSHTCIHHIPYNIHMNLRLAIVSDSPFFCVFFFFFEIIDNRSLIKMHAVADTTIFVFVVDFFFFFFFYQMMVYTYIYACTYMLYLFFFCFCFLFLFYIVVVVVYFRLFTKAPAVL